MTQTNLSRVEQFALEAILSRSTLKTQRYCAGSPVVFEATTELLGESPRIVEKVAEYFMEGEMAAFGYGVELLTGLNKDPTEIVDKIFGQILVKSDGRKKTPFGSINHLESLDNYSRRLQPIMDDLATKNSKLYETILDKLSNELTPDFIIDAINEKRARHSSEDNIYAGEYDLMATTKERLDKGLIKPEHAYPDHWIWNPIGVEKGLFESIDRIGDILDDFKTRNGIEFFNQTGYGKCLREIDEFKAEVNELYDSMVKEFTALQEQHRESQKPIWRKAIDYLRGQR